MYRVTRSGYALLLSALGLSACTLAPQYESITSTAATTSPLGGTALQLETTLTATTAVDVVQMSGSLTHNTGRITLDDGTYLLVDPNGFSFNGQLSDGVNSGARIDGLGTAIFANTYNYVLPFVYSYSSGAFTTVTGGMVGIVTSATDVPTAGSAQYFGESFVETTSSSGATAFSYYDGISIVDVDFAAGSVDVTMGFFTNIQQNGTATIAPIDALAGTGMSIVGASFVGGSWVTLKGGVVVNITGPGTTTLAGGDFYGYDSAISAPDEVGGVIVMDGSNGLIYGMFVAD
jgi:hypothetical protein